MFRIGFEPLFVDFTDRGAVYMVFMLFKWFIQALATGQCVNLAEAFKCRWIVLPVRRIEDDA